MKMNRKRVTVAVAGLAVAGALAGGGVALAAPGPSGPPAAAASTTGPGYGPMAGFGGMHGAMASANSVFDAAAQYLGLSDTDLRAQMQTGKSLADVAQAQGKSVTGLEDALVAAIQANLDANSTLSADQKSAILAQVKSHVATMVTNTHPVGSGHGPMGGFGGMRSAD